MAVASFTFTVAGISSTLSIFTNANFQTSSKAAVQQAHLTTHFYSSHFCDIHSIVNVNHLEPQVVDPHLVPHAVVFVALAIVVPLI